MTIDMSQFYEVFFEEAEELLAQAEQLLLAIDPTAPNPEDLNAIFRAAHSIKGGASTFGFDNVTGITHVLENLLDSIRKNELPLIPEHIEVFLEAKDIIAELLMGHRTGVEVDESRTQAMVKQLEFFNSQPAHGESAGVPAPQAKVAPTVVAAPAPEQVVAPTPVAEPAQSEQNVGSDGPTRDFLIRITGIEPKDVLALGSELELLGTIKNTDIGDGFVEITLNTSDSHESIDSMCSFIVESEQLSITELKPATPKPIAASTALPSKVSKPAAKKSDDLGFGFFDDEPDVPAVAAVSGATATPEPAVKAKEALAPAPAPVPAPSPVAAPAAAPVALAKPTATTAAAPAAPKAASPAKPAGAAASNASSQNTSIRVGIEKVDQLINLIGELVITQAMIEQRASTLDLSDNEQLSNSINQLSRNTRDLQDAVMSIRMVPMDTVFSRFPRMVHDLASKLGKKIDFVTEGAATELDKGLIEKVIDPLTHLVRNSLDHGIEIPAERVKKGKPETGRVCLSASNRSGNIVIEISDDGAGLNRERILAKARENGLDVHDGMTDPEVWNLIFAPGFSTAEKVTDISGRGVGMDVVKRNVAALGGSIEMRSQLGAGTVTTISMPLTLAIMDGMSIALGDCTYIVPLNMIIETLQPREEDLKTVTGGAMMIEVRKEYLPLISLSSIFDDDAEQLDPTRGVVMIVEAEGRKAALMVDDLLGQRQVVIKSLETNFKKIHGVSGATILGDGSVALIIDVPAIIKNGQTAQMQGAYA
jgi:two-component system chemotaxis sensor kinase CheA